MANDWDGSMEPGQNYYFQSTKGMDFVGRLVAVTGPFDVVLADAAWVAETGRLHAFLRDGRADGMEVEPVGAWRLTWCGVHPWPHSLFTDPV